MGKRTLFWTMLGVVVLVTVGLYASTNFPTSLDTYSDKTSSDLITAAGWNNMQDAIEACQAKIGIDSSATSTSHDYKINELEGYWTTSGLSKAELVNLNGVTATYGQINNSSKMVYGTTGGGVLRVIKVTMTYYSASQTRITIESLYNGDTLATTEVSDTGTYYDLNVTGNCLGVVSVYVMGDTGATASACKPYAEPVSNNLRMYPDNNGETLETSLPSSNTILFAISYLTSS